jgi:hypothetical protein
LRDGVERLCANEGRRVGQHRLDRGEVFSPLDPANRSNSYAARSDVRTSEPKQNRRERRGIARASVFGIEHALEERSVLRARRGRHNETQGYGYGGS